MPAAIGRSQRPVLILPKRLEPICCQLRVTHRMPDVPMAQIVLEGAGVMALVGKLVSVGVAEHVGVDRER
jgi:hypothetical protein